MRAVISVLSALALSPVYADGLADRVRFCAQMQDSEQRLACFDAEAARLPASAKPPTAQSQFGNRSRALAKQKEEDDTPDRIEAIVTALSNRPHGEAVLTLDNGQVWEQVEVQPQLTLRIGDKVSIEAGALRSYRLITASGRGAKVTRIE